MEIEIVEKILMSKYVMVPIPFKFLLNIQSKFMALI